MKRLKFKMSVLYEGCCHSVCRCFIGWAFDLTVRPLVIKESNVMAQLLFPNSVFDNSNWTRNTIKVI